MYVEESLKQCDTHCPRFKTPTHAHKNYFSTSWKFYTGFFSARTQISIPLPTQNFILR